MASIKSDELNIVRAIPFDEYFEPMAIEDYQKEQRIRLAEEISKAIFYILLMFETAKALKASMDAEQLRESMAQRYLDAIEGLGYDINDPYYEDHIRETSDSLVTTTMDNLNEPWFTSQDRADYIAEDEANSIANHADLEEAKSQGYTDKTWKTMKDERVRHTHRAVDEATVGIDEPFIVGHYKMLAPRDDSLGAGLEEIIRCRCSLAFLKKVHVQNRETLTNNIGDFSDLKADGSNGIIKLGLNGFDKSDPIYVDFFSIEEEQGEFNFGSHGDPKHVQVSIDGKYKNLTAEEFLEYLKSKNRWDGNKTIKLLCCSVGDGDESFGQQLSRLVDVDVLAPNDDVYYAPNEGVVFVGSPYFNKGYFRRFRNGVEILE